MYPEDINSPAGAVQRKKGVRRGRAFFSCAFSLAEIGAGVRSVASGLSAGAPMRMLLRCNLCYEVRMSEVVTEGTLSALLGIEVEGFGADGRGAVSMPLDGRHRNSMGNAHGGAVFTLADMAFAAGCRGGGTGVRERAVLHFLSSSRSAGTAAGRGRSREAGEYPRRVRHHGVRRGGQKHRQGRDDRLYRQKAEERSGA